MSSSSSFDFVAGFFRVVGSTLGQKSKAVLVSLAGAQGGDPTNQSDQAGEVAEDRLMYHALGVISRPLDPDSSSGKELRADAIGLRTPDGLIPVAWHDPRIDAAFPDGPAKGQIALVGYAGGFHSIGLTPDGSSNIHVIYAPYAFNGDGIPQKAHAVVLDTTSGNESIQLIHGEGYFLTAKAGDGWTMAVDGSTALAMKPSGVPGVAGKVTIAANVIVSGSLIIGNPASAVPLLPGPASPPCPYLFVSPA